MESFPVVAYELQYRLTNQGEGAESTLKISGDTLVGVVTDLVNAKNYEVCKKKCHVAICLGLFHLSYPFKSCSRSLLHAVSP